MVLGLTNHLLSILFYQLERTWKGI
ncbi:uncharacterized protein METZ01_LOCUS388475, partial [marine metagenome]